GVGRPEVHEIFPDLWTGRGVQEIHLPRLPRRAGERLVREALGAAAGAEVVRDLVERADGNALYLEELIRAVAQGSGAALPETVLAMVQARLSTLGAEERRALRAASVFGQTFSARGVEALLGGAPVETALRALVDAEVIAPASAGEHRFRHALVR